MSGNTFSLSLAKFAQAAPEQARTVVRKVAQEASAKIVLRSPVDTGRFHANWNAGIGVANETTTADLDKSGQAAIARANSVIDAADGVQTIYFTNSLPYAIPLEYGHSKKQAPLGMVRITVTEFQTYVDNAVRSLPK